MIIFLQFYNIIIFKKKILYFIYNISYKIFKNKLEFKLAFLVNLKNGNFYGEHGEKNR